MKKKQIRSNRKEPIKIILFFKDGTEIRAEDFDPKSLSQQQNDFIIDAFSKVFSKN